MRNIAPDAIHSERGNVRYFDGLREVARQNRKNPTLAEKKIWLELLSNKQTGFTFLRQKPIYRFIVDFYCSELCLAIEIDGSSHKNKIGTDRLRDEFMRKIGIRTIRISNEEILNNIKGVKEKLKVSLVKGRLEGLNCS